MFNEMFVRLAICGALLTAASLAEDFRRGIKVAASAALDSWRAKSG